MADSSKKWSQTVIYILAAVILWLCVKPVTVLTILRSETLLFTFIAGLMLLLYFRLPGWIYLAAGAGMIFFSVHFYFFNATPLFALSWIRDAAGDIVHNAALVWNGQLFILSDLFSAFLFFVMVWLICFTVRYWLRNGHIFLFLFLAAVALSVVDTFTFYDATPDMILVTVLGLVILGISKWVELKSSGTGSKASFKAWVMTVSAAAAGVLLLGILAPKAEAQWNGPARYLQHIGFGNMNQNGAFFSNGQRIGYDADDTALGGSLSMDDTPLFTAYVTGTGNYWRVSSKETYTGKGWADNHPYYVPLIHFSDVSDAMTLFEENTGTSKESARITFSSNSPAVLPYTGQLSDIRVPGRRLKLAPLSGQILTSEETRARTEQINYLEPTFRIDRLRQVTAESAGSQDPENIRKTYLQLPERLPSRVRELGTKLTSGESNRYDQVRHIVDYLRSSRFTYSIDRVPRPSQNQDYVDQFLFESKIGYCDNFSTSLVVLLRSAGIPARWVKGFTTGEYTGQENANMIGGKSQLTSAYEITNANAHSWAEVYFPGSGWVTFEATPSFNNPNQFVHSATGSGTQAQENGQSESASGAQNQQNPAQQQKKPAQSHQNTPQQEKKDGANVQAKAGDQNRFPFFPVALAAGGILLAAGLVYLILTRRKWMAAYYLRKQKKMIVRDGTTFCQAFENLSRLLRIKGFRRADSQTVYEFSTMVDRILSGHDMKQLAGYYEQLIYSGRADLPAGEQPRISRLFRRVLRKLFLLKQKT
ncbi:transglutaminase domain-containing protein [Sporolactobacillus sp. Y61]|uniref:Transglutaminase domain-containing protein n=1 Tax=Sporolactobacillus sp. Y61 TaxID=3160863 RepID=A0AAU8IF65_9BACL